MRGPGAGKRKRPARQGRTGRIGSEAPPAGGRPEDDGYGSEIGRTKVWSVERLSTIDAQP